MTLTTSSDDALVERVRETDAAAYGELWLRHSAAAHAVARAYSSLDSDDLVAEAFARILAAIARGAGPQMGFRPYLLTSVRNVAAEWGAREQRADAADLEDAEHASAPAAEHEALSALENSAAAVAFRSLPTRWQEALWFSEVDGLKPRQFAPLLGLAPNAASALVVRARRGFRDAWIGTQLRTAGSDECRTTIGLLGSHTRGALSRRDARTVDAHLDTCDGCAIAWAEARDVASRLALVLLPIVVGVPATAAYAAWTQSAGSQAVSVAIAAGTEAAPASSASRFTRLRSRRVTTAAAVAAVVAVAGIIGVAAAQSGSGPQEAAVESVLAAPPTLDDPAPSAAEPELVPDITIVAEPAPTPTPRPTPTPTQTPTPPEAAPALAPDPAPTSSPLPTSAPSPTPTPEPTPAPARPAAPTMTADLSAGPTVYPLLAGSDAVPAAAIEVLDGDGTVWGRTAADDAGAWQVSDLSGGACTTDAAAYLPAGDHTLAVRQIVEGVASELGTPTAVTVAAPPSITAPADGAEVAGTGFILTITGEPGASVQRIKLPDAAPCRPTPMLLDATGVFSQEFTVPDRGVFVLGARYIDAVSGRHGPAVFTRLTAY
ncbi:sigma-70 family RNA polymerase sigma factor [Microbacterium sp. NPDC089189]|uniref:sigma-70 family RNA polymerase sigma factor n=1 Tax=Microbacterium sp. NPDC089189 TaxID=3154972 RepID=UPI00341EBCB5